MPDPTASGARLDAELVRRGLARSRAVAVEAIAGLSIETAILLPIAVAWLAFGFAEGRPVFGTTEAEAWLLIAAGVASTTPLLLFTAAARRQSLGMKMP